MGPGQTEMVSESYPECLWSDFLQMWLWQLFLSVCPTLKQLPGYPKWRYVSGHLAVAASCTAYATGSRGRKSGQWRLGEDTGSSYSTEAESPFHSFVALSNENGWEGLALEELKHQEILRVDEGRSLSSYLKNFSSCCTVNVCLVPCRACCSTFLFHALYDQEGQRKLILPSWKHYFIWVF